MPSPALTSSLSADLLARVSALASARDESVDNILRRFPLSTLQKFPKKYPEAIPALRNAHFIEAGIRDGFAFAALQNGRRFYGWPSTKRHRLIHSVLADILPPQITEDLLTLGLDIAFRYLANFNWPPPSIAPAAGETVVELGSYLGHKLVRFADCIGPQGRLLAVEMMPENAEILERNVAENRLTNITSIAKLGVWSEQTSLSLRSRGSQQNSITNLEKLPLTEVQVDVDSLDNIARANGVDAIDFLYITVNGAEVEALRGGEEILRHTRKVFVNSPYSIDGRNNGEECRQLLKRMGFQLVQGFEASHICATRNT